MSKIARIRILNLNYNHDSIRIGDETFDLGGESTLLSLRNGGGKSVLVQMIISLFVNKTHRDFGEREFKSYFTTNKPTFIMTEWKLDNNEEWFLAGMMVRKNQQEEKDTEDLEMYTFTGSYSGACRYDLDNIPLVKQEGARKALKGFAECKKVLEEISQDREGDFRLYDMAGRYGRSQYYQTLRQFQINSKEWESIIKKINLKESGLSDLFRNSKDEKNLVENWFLKPIEDKLNQEKNKVEEFRRLMLLFVEQYRKNQANIERKVVIEQYFEDTVALQTDIAAYVEKQEEKELKISQMTIYAGILAETITKLVGCLEEAKEQLWAVREKQKHIDYEEISYKVYQYREQKQELSYDRASQEGIITALSKQTEGLKRQLEVYDCSRIYEELREFQAQSAENEEKIKKLLQTSEENQEVIAQIGRQLWQYYQVEIQKRKADCMQKEAEHRQRQEEKVHLQKEKEENEDRINSCSKNIGKLEKAVEGYGEAEEAFVQKYRTMLKRNLEGWYPEGFLAVKQKEMEEEAQEENNRLARLSKNKQEGESMHRSLEQQEREEILSQNEVLHHINAQEQRLIELTEEKEYRLKILRYLDLEETEADHTDRIKGRLWQKIRELNTQKSYLQTQKAAIEKQYTKWKEGKIVDLPDNLLEYLEQNGIEFLYGMEWLAKNGRTVQENTKLISKNPFIPYAMILEKEAFDRLKETNEALYTSFPIPLLLRQELEQHEDNAASPIRTYGKLHFWVMFNEQLLDREELERLLQNLKEQIAMWEGRIQEKEEDISAYSQYAYDISNQTYSEALYNQTQKELDSLLEKQKQIEEKQKKIREEKELLAQKLEKNQQEIENSKEKREFYAQRKIAFERLGEKYQAYEGNKRSLLREEKEQKELIGKKETYRAAVERIERELVVREAEMKTCKDRIAEYDREADTYRVYGEAVQGTDSQSPVYGEAKQGTDSQSPVYGEAEQGTDSQSPVSAEAADRLKAQYNALTRNISENLEELKKRQKQLYESIRKKTAALSKKNKSKLAEEEYQTIVFTEEQYELVEKNIEETQIQLNAVKEKNIEITRKIAGLEKDIEYRMEELKEKTGREKLIEKQFLVDLDFEKRRQLQKHEEELLLKKEKGYENKKNELQAMLGGVAEYAGETVKVSEEERERLKQEIPDLETTPKAVLEDYQARLRKSIHRIEQEISNCRSCISEEILSLKGKKEYADDYFQKTFASLLSQTNSPKLLEAQYRVNRESYESQLEKLKIDLENIEEERKNIEEMFLEYIKSINDNVAMIDKNSTIKVRDRSIKMLRIQVPDWEIEKEHFKLKLHDFMEGLIKYGLQTIEENKNLEEFLGNAISTKKLYDEIVGIRHVKIKMYKIEEEREVPITWAEVAANSGGEGFLSAFVILTCLLSYMRRDENDIFASGEEGKVLIMDNPFAQTYSAHLLKPLMEMAKKTNTQLICLSGLSGDSIYNRFDNIYVLKLVNSGIHPGTLRMESNHIKGEDIRKMVLSDFKTEAY